MLRLTGSFLIRRDIGQRPRAGRIIQSDDGDILVILRRDVEDDEYVPARNALNNENGDQIFKLYFASIRNAGDAKYVISDCLLYTSRCV